MQTETDGRRRVVLVYPRFPDRLPALSMAMGPFYVGSFLANHGYDVVLLDANNFASDKHLFGALSAEMDSALAVGLSVMTAQIPDALKIARFVREVVPSVPIVWGGVHPSLFPEQTAVCQLVDYVVDGEGEETMLGLLRALGDDSDRKSVSGLVYQDSAGRVVRTGTREPVDVNELPPLCWELLETIKPGVKLTLAQISRLSGRGIYLQTSRGCPHRCAFCVNSVLKLTYRERRSELVLSDIEELIARGVDNIWFTDEIFFASKRRVMGILDGIESRQLKFKWFADIRADYFNPRHVDRDLLMRMKRDGCEILGIGAESGSQRVLDTLKKDITPDNTLDAARQLTEAGMKANFSFMVGLPGEEREDVLRTLRLIEAITRIDGSLALRILGPQVYRPYPGSELYLECLAQGMKEPATVEEWAFSPYIRSESIVDADAYPWIRHSADFINNVAFYGMLSGIRLRYGFLTSILRKIASMRCRRLYFGFPIEKTAYDLFTKTRAYRLLSIKNALGNGSLRDDEGTGEGTRG